MEIHWALETQGLEARGASILRRFLESPGDWIHMVSYSQFQVSQKQHLCLVTSLMLDAPAKLQYMVSTSVEFL